ncbi:protoporphyrinogen oxidase [Evansella cellulosilytica]|uniref:Coproporphyrinogen III oxidase n=1 Tax=Evansella cellulosilytica (strain ATCC 21833 / DSM 2522 / FERM P-1141 / JCM 9156 / N-4) TaxID=649639 RepID=E6TV60_EVAC2|nr:protoporphyrinogen oxidase [Evansella cellulosilytica]ADU29744.1 protoporphyrinogen oxidase [Evansella cellulosilytica DSM 2522]
MPKRIAIIGGGITGLSAAYYLQKELSKSNSDAEFVLYEAADELGGKIKTSYRDGFISELGPDSFLARKKSMAELAKEVGLENDLVHNSSGKSYILHNDTLYPMPGGAIMGIPTQWGPFLKTRLFSPAGKARAAGDLFLPKVMKNGEDVSLGSFFRKRLGNEVVDKLIEPLLSGIYAGNIDKLSLQATFPHFEQIEKKYGSMILGMKSSIAKQQEGKPKNRGKTKPKGMFLSFKGGLQSFVRAIEEQLDKSVVKKNAKLLQIKKVDNRYRLLFEDGRDDVVDYMLITTPHHITYQLLKDYSAVSYLGKMPATSVATVVLAFPKSAIKKDIDGSGFVVSKKSNYSITACTWTHKKWEHSTPEGYAQLRGYVGREGNEDIVFRSDEEIIHAVMKDLSAIMDIEGEPKFSTVTRWKEAMPQYEVGHRNNLNDVYVSMKKQLPGVYLTGGSFEGIGMPDCIDQGKKGVSNLLSELGAN